jgi:hypothetical protein
MVFPRFKFFKKYFAAKSGCKNRTEIFANGIQPALAATRKTTPECP